MTDIAGQKFGKLVALYPVQSHELPNEAKRHRWMTRCECGRERVVWLEHLKSGHTRSCGCLRGRPRTGAKGTPNIRSIVLERYKFQAKQRGYVWGLTPDEFYSITQQPCHYCGLPPSNVTNKRGGKYVYSGIDRKDNGQGYVAGNSVPCCRICNKFKSSLPYEEFIAYLDRVSKFRNCNEALNG